MHSRWNLSILRISLRGDKNVATQPTGLSQPTSKHQTDNLPGGGGEGGNSAARDLRQLNARPPGQVCRLASPVQASRLPFANPKTLSPLPLPSLFLHPAEFIIQPLKPLFRFLGRFCCSLLVLEFCYRFLSDSTKLILLFPFSHFTTAHPVSIKPSRILSTLHNYYMSGTVVFAWFHPLRSMFFLLHLAIL